MNIINIEGISKIYGDKTIFQNASFGVQEGDKIGIVGINGTGKSTLLKMIAGFEEPDEGRIVRKNGLGIAYLPQTPVFPANATVASYMQDCGLEWKMQSNLTKLGILEYDVPIVELSGGQKRKVALANVLAKEADVLLLDEPTNHLDGSMIVWLETCLREWKGTILMVTHDRYFLDQVTNRILEISHGAIYGYDADYSGFLKRKAEREEMELASERKRQSVLRMELEWAKRGCRARSTKQRARLERLETLKNTAAPTRDGTVALDSVETRMGKKTVELREVSKSYGEKTLLKDYSYLFLKNQKVGIIGPNGCGKTTLIKMIAGLVEPDAGCVEIGDTVRIGYFAQEDSHMDDNQRVIDYVKEIGEYIETREGNISASQMLERFLFTPDMQYSLIGRLSGGEKRRLYLLGVLCGNINVLLLDEASNNLDIPTLTILEDYLSSFSGIVITVSHDRYFLDNVADRILEFGGDGVIRQYEGGYTDYLEAKKREAKEKDDRILQGRTQTVQNSGRERRKNHTVKLKFTFQEQREFETIDDEICELEKKVSQLETEIWENATDPSKLQELTGERERAEALLEEKMDRWLYLNDLAERIAAQ